MSVLTTTYTRAGFTAQLSPPQPGIYFPTVAIYNALTQIFTVQNGVSQDNLASQLAVLYQVSSTGQSIALFPAPRFYPYGAYLGPVQAVWYEPGDVPGSFPMTLGALTGLIQWTPAGTALGADPVYLVPGTAISSVVVSNASDTSETITVTGLQSGEVLGVGELDGNTSVQITLAAGTSDTVFVVTSSGSITATLSIVVGVPPVATPVPGGGGGATVFYASLTGDGETVTPGDLTQAGGFTITDDAGNVVFSTPDGISGGTIQIGQNSLLAGESNLFAYFFNASMGAKNELSLEAVNGSGDGGALTLLAGTGATLSGNAVTISGGGVEMFGAITLAGMTGNTVVRVGTNVLAFFDVTPVGQQVSGGTLAGVIAGLVDLGLFSS